MRILLIAHIPPGPEYTAGMVLEKICNIIPHDSLRVCTIAPRFVKNPISKNISSAHQLVLSQPREIGRKKILKSKILGQVATFIINTYGFYKIRKLTERVKKFIIDEKITHIWVLMESITTIRVAAKIEREMNLGVFAQCTDLPGWYLNEIGTDVITKKNVKECFDLLVKNSTACAVPSKEMKDLFESRFGKNCTLLANSMELDLKNPKFLNLNNDRIVIGFAGQIYAKDAWDSFIASLDYVNWKIGSKEIFLKILGKEIPLKPALGKRNILLLGYRTENEVIETLEECDLLYCPYPFGEEYKEVTTYSFPSKFPVYLSTGVGVLVHAPQGSSISNYALQNQCAFVCNSLDNEMILQTINESLSRETYNNILKNSAFTYRNDFSIDRFEDSVKDFFKL